MQPVRSNLNGIFIDNESFCVYNWHFGRAAGLDKGAPGSRTKPGSGASGRKSNERMGRCTLVRGGIAPDSSRCEM